MAADMGRGAKILATELYDKTLISLEIMDGDWKRKIDSRFDLNKEISYYRHSLAIDTLRIKIEELVEAFWESTALTKKEYASFRKKAHFVAIEYAKQKLDGRIPNISMAIDEESRG